MAVVSLYMAEAGLLAGLELVVWLVLVLVHVLQEVWSQGRQEWMRKIGVDHNNHSSCQPRVMHVVLDTLPIISHLWTHALSDI